MNSCPQCGGEFEPGVAFCPKDGTPLASARPDTPDLIGKVIADRYRITSRLGGGGMGQVYKAEHVRMKRICAIKVLRPSLANENEANRRFQREAESASRISHPNVAQIYDFGEHEGLVYLAMEFIAGESLAAVLKRQGAVHPSITADVVSQSASALSAAHAHGVIHRDVKPDNIMLSRSADGSWTAKLVDFGIARASSSDEQNLTRTGLVIGTPEYMSPEQIAGEGIDERADLYSLALVAFQCLTGRHAFPKQASRKDLVHRLTNSPRTLSEARTDMDWPIELQQVFNRALAPDPAERHSAINEFAKELSSVISAMSPTDLGHMFQRALDRRGGRDDQVTTTVSSDATTPDVSLAAITREEPQTPDSEPVAHTYANKNAATVALPSRSTARITRSSDVPAPVLRRRPRTFQWFLLFIALTWAYLAFTDQTEKAKLVLLGLWDKTSSLVGGAITNVQGKLKDSGNKPIGLPENSPTPSSNRTISQPVQTQNEISTPAPSTIDSSVNLPAEELGGNIEPDSVSPDTNPPLNPSPETGETP